MLVMCEAGSLINGWSPLRNVTGTVRKFSLWQYSLHSLAVGIVCYMSAADELGFRGVFFFFF